jgi:hypothetical protein
MESAQSSSSPSSGYTIQASPSIVSPEVAPVRLLDTSDSMSSVSTATAHSTLPSDAGAFPPENCDKLPLLTDDQEEVMTSKLLGPIKMYVLP